MTVASKLRAATTPAAAGGFDPETDITWHSLFWAEGSSMSGYSDTDSVGTWYNETGESDATEATNPPTFDAVNAGLNNQPAIYFDGTERLATANFSVSPSTPYSLVAIVKYDSVAVGDYICDGNDSTNRNLMSTDGVASYYAIWSGSWQANTTVVDTAAHLWVATGFDGSTGTKTLDIDGTNEVSANSGNRTLDGLTLGDNYAGTAKGTINLALFGIYEGDITADGSWSDFTTWVSDHYGITIA